MAIFCKIRQAGEHEPERTNQTEPSFFQKEVLKDDQFLQSRGL